MLINREWKHSFESNPSNSVTSLVSLWDLMFDENGKSWYNDYRQSATLGRPDLGCHLEHDIICFNEELYNIDAGKDTAYNVEYEIDESNVDESTLYPTVQDSEVFMENPFYTFGFDIAIPHYSAASRPKVITINNNNKNVKLYVNDKNGVIPYGNLLSFSANSISMNQTWGRETYVGDIVAPAYCNNFIPLKVGPFKDLDLSEEATQKDTFEIYLKGLNDTFTEDNNIEKKFSAYNNICIDPSSNFAKYLILRTICSDSNDITNVIKWNQNSNNAVYSINTKSDISGLDTWKINYENNEFKEILKNSYVWIRAPFFADYVKPSSYNQNLNKDSRVVHRDLILSSKGDFNEYNESVKVNESIPNEDGQGQTIIKDDNVDWIESLPFISQTAPFIDTLRPSNYQSSNESWFENEDVGGIPIPTTMFKVGDNLLSFDDTNESEPYDLKMFCPFIYWNTEYAETLDSEGKWNTFNRKNGVPVFTTKYGNIYTDGRVFSPSIDELWIAIKKLICGREADAATIYDSFARAKGFDKNGVLYTNEGTQIPYSNGTIWKFQQEGDIKIGDPIEFKMGKYDINDKGEVKSFTETEVKKYINHNNTIDYTIYDSIQSLNDTLNETGCVDFNDRKSNFFFSVPYYDDATCNIYGKTEIEYYQLNNSNISSANATEKFRNIFGPRTYPYSLRELEALTKGNRFNIESLAIWLEKNGAINSRVTKRIANSAVSSDNYNNEAKSGLYQFHKDYSGSHSKNTQYVQNGDSGYLQFDDNSKFATHYTSRASFGRTRISNTQNKVDSSQVFLAADGTWRYLFEKPRAQIVETSR